MSLVLPSVAAISINDTNSHMEVADQWRREWTGAAEYGKVTEGGVTRRVARAMEVLHASGPGSRVRVLRAAYHSTAGPGTPAASFLLHSSRRVISSGFNVLESPTTPSKPLEISSMPLETSPEFKAGLENYKVTEPDDYEISAPSKWRSPKVGSSFRMPSEESSSTDNASIIDLDPRTGRNLHRKYSYDSESSDIQFGKRNSTRASPLLDPPVVLSTLKYKSLLNSSNEWNRRRKSYSFEDTSPLNETILHSNDTLAMESSTDSGICKSTEIVNDHLDDNSHAKYFPQNERKTNSNDESFKDWLFRNRPNSQYKTARFNTYREHDIVLEDPVENNITLQSSGKVSITLPIAINKDDEDDNNKRSYFTEESERKVKKVEFCKTELHFAAESGKVNIIATDEKPPPSNDFKKRRSAFVPMNDIIDRPITLFGEKSQDLSTSNGTVSSFNNFSIGEFGEPDENTAATKSILKNKIPKPKPYLLGENMGFGLSDKYKDHHNDSVLRAVSLVNKQLELEKNCDSEIKSILLHDADSETFKNNIFRTISKGPLQNDFVKQEKHTLVNIRNEKSAEVPTEKDDKNLVKNKFYLKQQSPVQGSPKTRKLRESDLTYFGVQNDRIKVDKDKLKHYENSLTSENSYDDIFNSVKLIQQVSNSVCNSEVESEESLEYQNIPLNKHYAPKPTPRIRSKYDDNTKRISDIEDNVLKTIMEKDDDIKESFKENSRRSKLRRQDETTRIRSLSAPPKSFRNSSLDNSNKREQRPSRIIKNIKNEPLKENVKKLSTENRMSTLDDENPIYVNLNIGLEKLTQNPKDKSSKTNLLRSPRSKSCKIDMDKNKNERKTPTPISEQNTNHRLNTITQRQEGSRYDSLQKKKSVNKHSPSRRNEKSNPLKTTENHSIRNTHKYRENEITDEQNTENIKRKEHRIRSSQSQPLKSINLSKEVITEKTNSDHCDTEIRRKGDNEENKSPGRKNSKDKISSKSDNAKQPHDLILNSVTSQSKTAELRNTEKGPDMKSNGLRANKRREYVINYDDKNGTVSSVTKIKSGFGSPRRKKTSTEVLKEVPKANTIKIKAANKIALLQLDDHQGDPNRVSYADSKWKTKVHVQRSCQVL